MDLASLAALVVQPVDARSCEERPGDDPTVESVPGIVARGDSSARNDAYAQLTGSRFPATTGALVEAVERRHASALNVMRRWKSFAQLQRVVEAAARLRRERAEFWRRFAADTVSATHPPADAKLAELLERVEATVMRGPRIRSTDLERETVAARAAVFAVRYEDGSGWALLASQPL